MASMSSSVVALGGQGHGLDRQDAPQLERAAHELVPRRDRASFSPLTSVPSISSPARSRHEATTVPAPWRVVMRPSASSRASEARRVRRLTPRASESSRSLGSRVPGRRRPDEDLAAQPVGDGVDHALPGDRGQRGERLRGRREARGGGSGLRSCPVLYWFNHLTCSRDDAQPISQQVVPQPTPCARRFSARVRATLGAAR